jgi:hypothetical protein
MEMICTDGADNIQGTIAKDLYLSQALPRFLTKILKSG